ncbi:MAG TPA: MlaD family protein [Gammaproteobacteria bacterium]|jgi:phospholipid/cholesterol/gamma-HCH transport system substrate-binding protein
MATRDPKQTHYVHYMKYSHQERLVGIFVLTAIGTLIALLFISGQTLRLFDGRVHYFAYMRNAAGVSAATEVRISGIQVGSVRRISLNKSDNRFIVELSIYEDFRELVRVDSTLSASKLTFIGDSVLNVTPGSPDKPLLPDGGMIEVKETMTLDQILANLTPALDTINSSIDRIAEVMGAIPPESILKTLEQTEQITGNLNEISRRIAAGEGTVGALIANDQPYRELNEALAQLQAILTDIRKISGPAVSADLPGALQQLGETIAIVRREVETLPGLSAGTRELLNNMDGVIEALRHTWPISSKLPPSPQPELLLNAGPSHD